jgi:thiamine biosynthesis lipoprotein
LTISVPERMRAAALRIAGVRCLKIVGILLLGGGLGACADGSELVDLSGQTMGTTYRVQYPSAGTSGEAVESIHDAIDRLLREINQSLSTYIETSLVSGINASTDTSAWHPVDSHLATVFDRSRFIYEETGGAFNPAVGPLVNIWGFGPDSHDEPATESEIASVLPAVDFDAFLRRDSPPAIQKRIETAALDFSGIAKGYGVDAVAELLDAEAIGSYFVEIGGEVRTEGQHPSGRPWRLGIERPDSASTGPRSHVVLALNDGAVATSGDYRNYYVRNGIRYTHILDPATGRPEASPLLSVSVLAEDCMTADAYATAFMVMGVEAAMDFVNAHPDLEAYFISSDVEGGYLETQSSGFPVADSQ